MPFSNTIDFIHTSDVSFEISDNYIKVCVINMSAIKEELCQINTNYPLNIYIQYISVDHYRISALEITKNADYDGIVDPTHIVHHHHQTDTTMRLGFYLGNHTHKYKIIGTEDDRPTCKAVGSKNKYAYSMSGDLFFRAKILMIQGVYRLVIKYPTSITNTQYPQNYDAIYCFKCV